MRIALLCALVGLLLWPQPLIAGVRGVVPGAQADLSDGFDPAESAALFVGVSEFAYDKTLTPVRYAVDDAVDLAHMLSLGAHTPLVDASRIVLALSGQPQKAESRAALQALRAAGAEISTATHSDVLTLLEQQSRLAGSQGLLIVAFATHGVSDDGTLQLLTASSLLRHRETTIPETKVRDLAARSNAARSLILFDACRQRLASDTREGEPDPRSMASLIRAMAAVSGQVVLSAAGAGEYAFDDDARRNGVFTAAVLDGLRCGAETDEHGFITAEKLAEYVQLRVLAWIRQHRDPKARRATQLSSDGRSIEMPLVACAGKRAQ